MITIARACTFAVSTEWVTGVSPLPKGPCLASSHKLHS